MNHFKTRRGQTYWYRIYHYKCPECGKERIIKRRERFAPKPTTVEEQHTRIEAYDYCKETMNP